MPTRTDALAAPRLILCHKQKTSARLRFLRFQHGILAFDPLPPDSTLCLDPPVSTLHVHPAAWTRQAAERLGLAPHLLQAEAGFYVQAHAGVQHITILLACFTSEDPPFETARRCDASFIAITEARTALPQELALLRLAYEHLIG